MAITGDRIRLRIILLASIVMIPMAGLLIWRFYVVQVQKHDYYSAEAKKRYVAVRKTRNRRGEIFDTNGYLLVANAPAMDITCAPCNLKDDQQRQRLAFLMKKFFGHDFRRSYQKLAPEVPKRDPKGKVVTDESGNAVMRPNQYVMIARGVALKTAQAFREQATSKTNHLGKALYFTNTSGRTYPKGRMLANVLGYINVENDVEIPQGGLEKQLASQISPQEGRMVYERNRDGSPLLYGFQEIHAGRDGQNVYLTIDEPIQAILEEELDAGFEKWHPVAAYAAIADPRTGNILALAQRPNFDPNDRSTYRIEAIGTRIAMDAFGPGSVAKPFTVGKALDCGVVRPETIIDCEKGVWFYGGKRMTDTHAYGVRTVSGVIQKSSNIGTAKIAVMLGDARVREAFTNFGFGTRTGLPLAGEHPGLIHPLKKWDKLTGTRVAIGYSVQITPLQLLRGYCGLANNGLMPQLRLVDRTEDPETGKVTKIPMKPYVRAFRRPETAKELMKMMVTVTQEGGTAQKAAIPGYHVAGKTGTARKYITGVGYSMHDYYASFIGFVPAENPRLVMVVNFDSPRGATYGGTVAGPVFRRTMERVLKHLNVQPDPALLPPEKSK